MKNESAELIVKYNIGETEIKLTPSIVKEYVLGNSNANITMSEFKTFTELCKCRKLNPFIKGEVHLIKYGSSPAQIVVGKDAILKRATLHPQFNGFKSGVIVHTEQGKIEKREGCFKLDSDILVGSWCEVFRKDWANSIYVSCTFSEIKKDSNPSWKIQPCLMAEKTAIVRALRTAFVEDLGGLYESDEIERPHTSGFSESDLNCSCEPEIINIDKSTGEVKCEEETTKIDLADL